MNIRHALCAGVAVCGLASPVVAQSRSDAETVETEDNEIIVTAVARGQNRIESSVSVSTIAPIRSPISLRLLLPT